MMSVPVMSKHANDEILQSAKQLKLVIAGL